MHFLIIFSSNQSSIFFSIFLYFLSLFPDTLSNSEAIYKPLIGMLMREIFSYVETML